MAREIGPGKIIPVGSGNEVEVFPGDGLVFRVVARCIGANGGWLRVTDGTGYEIGKAVADTKDHRVELVWPNGATFESGLKLGADTGQFMLEALDAVKS